MSKWSRLRLQYPLLYREIIGFDCGPGWFDIIRDLSLKLEVIIARDIATRQIPEGEEEGNEMYAVQVKEKYGTLRFYMSSETEEMSELIREAEALSSQTCECCGAFGKMRGKQWMEVRCDNCYKETK